MRIEKSKSLSNFSSFIFDVVTNTKGIEELFLLGKTMFIVGYVLGAGVGDIEVVRVLWSILLKRGYFKSAITQLSKVDGTVMMRISAYSASFSLSKVTLI